MQAKGWDAAHVKPLMNNIKTAKGWRRRKDKAVGHDSRPQE